jgi:trehalose 6-phosphate phosphatase
VLALDFDGTLAPIVLRPDEARADPETISLLAGLSGRLRQVVVISGRDSDDLAARLPIPTLRLFGNHGLEQRLGGRATVDPQALRFQENLRVAAENIKELPVLRTVGVTLERKLVSLSVHYRNATDRAAVGPALGEALQMIATAAGLALNPGRLVWELRPPVTMDKGVVLERLATEFAPEAMIYLGDDSTDQAAFAALKRLSGLTTLAVGISSGETPAGVFQDCELLLVGVAGVKGFLNELARFASH